MGISGLVGYCCDVEIELGADERGLIRVDDDEGETELEVHGSVVSKNDEMGCAGLEEHVECSDLREIEGGESIEVG